jgi:hypothetical protein
MRDKEWSESLTREYCNSSIARRDWYSRRFGIVIQKVNAGKYCFRP